LVFVPPLAILVRPVAFPNHRAQPFPCDLLHVRQGVLH
jgi:hypothetical protein